MKKIKVVAIDGIIHMSESEFWNIQNDIRENAIEDCKEVVRQLWIKGYLLPTIAGKIYGDLDKLKEPENDHSNVSKQKTSNV